MRNINELVGIIEAIDFDKVINIQEIEHLRNWVEYNRNLAYEPEHVKLLNLVEEVIEDNVITEEEKIKLFKGCEAIQKGVIEDSVKIYELNGIIEGIICDGEVNDLEVRKLRQWMNNNDELMSYQSIV